MFSPTKRQTKPGVARGLRPRGGLGASENWNNIPGPRLHVCRQLLQARPLSYAINERHFRPNPGSAPAFEQSAHKAAPHATLSRATQPLAAAPSTPAGSGRATVCGCSASRAGWTRHEADLDDHPAHVAGQGQAHRFAQTSQTRACARCSPSCNKAGRQAAVFGADMHVLYVTNDRRPAPHVVRTGPSASNQSPGSPSTDKARTQS